MPQIEEILSKAFIAAGVDPALAVIVRSERPDLAHYQCNGAFLAAKAAKQNPRALAEQILSHIDASEGMDTQFSVAGPGYINVSLGPQTFNAMFAEPLCSVPQHNGRIVLDFGGPNVAKPMHVGHLRSLVIGDSLQRILRFVGYEVISDIHLGDWGLQMGLLLAALEGTSLHEITLDMLEDAYPKASERAKLDEPFKIKAQMFTRLLQQGDEELLKRWKRFYDLSMATVERELTSLGINFTCYKGESDAQASIPDMVQAFIDRDIAHENDGALVVPVSGDTPLLLRKSDGASLYSTTDLATILDRTVQYAPDKIIYVTDQRQALHFEQVFEAAQKIGYVDEGQLEHVGFGTVNGPDGKPLKTRDGGVPKLNDLIQEAIAKAAEKNPDVAEIVAMAALKFADLQNPRKSSYIFDLDKFLSFEGKTGPYVMYQAVRIKSILAKSVMPSAAIKVETPLEVDLAFKLLIQFPAAVEDAVRLRSPKELVDHLYDLAQTFSKFYANHSIADDPSRVALSIRVLAQLQTGLNLLGIDVPEKM